MFRRRAFAEEVPLLLATRAIEGVGFFAVAVAAPALIAAVAPPQDRDRAFSVWATFFPVGMAVIMLSAPLLTALGWRGFWLVNAAVLIGYAGLLAMGTRSIISSDTQRRGDC